MSLLPAIVAAPRRVLRVLVVSDSILNTSNWRAQLAALTGIPAASIDVCVRAYGGAQSPAGLAQLATDVAAYGQQGNLLPNSDLSAWQKTNCTATVDANPVTGRRAVRVDGTAGSSWLNTSGGTSTAFNAPTGAPPLTFSVEITRGATNSLELLIRNNTAGGTVINRQLRQSYLDANAAGGLPTRYAVTALPTDGVGYAAGNQILCYIYVGNTDAPDVSAAWLADPLVNVGIWPLAYSATSGTAETPAAAAWVTPTQAIADMDLFDLCVVSFGPNDQGVTPAASYEAILAAMARGAAARGVRRVLLATPPPLAASGLGSWSGTQVYDADGYRTALISAATDLGAYVYDAWSDFQARVTGGSNTVANLMRDTVHPSDAAVGNAGLVAYATETLRRVAAPRQGGMPGDAPFVRLGAESATGGWAPTTLTQAATSPNNDLGSLVSAFSASGQVRAYTSTAAGTLTITTPACEEIGLLHLVHSTSGGVVDVSVDGGAAVSVDTTVSGIANNYGRATFIAGGLSRTTHTVEIDWVSGAPAVVGVSGC